MKTKTFPIVGTKSSLLWDEDSDAWVYISGRPVRKEEPREYWSLIPTLYRAVDMRAKALSNLPWVLKRGETVIDSSYEYQNTTGLVSSMNTMFYLVEASLTLAGAAYWKREQNIAGFDKLRHLDPTSMNLDEDKARNGILEWKRVELTQKIYTPKEIVYMWYPDPYIEIGPPSAWPAQTALTACGVLANLDEFAKNYFGRGAIKAMLFAMQGSSLQEAQKFESWWQQFIGSISNAFRTKVINAEKVEPVVVGEGIKELENVTLTRDKQEGIAIAMSIPMSLLFANAANYATAERDKLNWYEDLIVPEANMIAHALNEQVYEPMGLKLMFEPQSLDIFQEDEKERAAAMSQFIDAVNKAGSIEMAQAMFGIFGVDIDEEAMALIEKHFSEKEERAAEMAEQLQPRPVDQPGEQPDDEDETPPMRSVDYQQLSSELSRWQSKCLSAVKRGNSANVPWVPILIAEDQYWRIVEGLETAKDADSVKKVFASSNRNDPTPTQEDTRPVVHAFEYANLLNEIKELTEALTNEKATI